MLLDETFGDVLKGSVSAQVARYSIGSPDERGVAASEHTSAQVETEAFQNDGKNHETDETVWIHKSVFFSNGLLWVMTGPGHLESMVEAGGRDVSALQ